MWNIPMNIPVFGFSHFAVMVDYELSSPANQDCTGLMFQNEGDNNFIYLCIHNNGKYRIHANKAGDWIILAESMSLAVLPDGMNRINFIGVDGTYLLFINDQFVNRVESDLLRAGRVHLLLGVEANDEATVYFDNLDIRGSAFSG